jgi:alpha-galactosidase
VNKKYPVERKKIRAVKNRLYDFRLPLIFGSILFIVSCKESVPDNVLALTPPMGWNSWNTFQTDINETKIKKIADIMVSSGMRDAGYVYLVLDDGWMAKERDSNGNLYGDPEKFPGGMKVLGDYIHSKGLKFGIYECRGYLTCQKLPGSFNHEEQDMKTFAGWGVDYVKLDACYAERNHRSSNEDLAIYRKAIDKTKRPIVLSISDFGNGSWAWDAKNYAQLWRTSYDISPDIESVYYCANTSGGNEVIHPAFNGLWQFAGPGHWNDPDMLEVGNLKSTIQDKAHFSLWCILSAPLMAGNDLLSMPDSVRKILIAPEIISVDQDSRGMQGYKVYDNGKQEIYNKPLSDGTTAVLLLNKDKDSSRITVTWGQLGLSGSQKVRDLWERKDLGLFKDSFTTERLGQHGLMFLKIGTHGGSLIPGPDPVPLKKYSITENGTTWLSDIYYIMKQGNAPVSDRSYNGKMISVKGKEYQKGLGCKGNSRIMYMLDSNATSFHTVAAVDDSYRGEEKVRFRVLNGDFFSGQTLYDTGTIPRDSAVHIDIDVKDVQCILLITEGKEVPADWADVKVVSNIKLTEKN